MNKRILASLMIIGLVGIGLGSTTMAMFNDTETSQGNQFTAGELDLRVDWDESYNGEHVETQELTNNPGTIFNFEDLKPGDHGEATISLHLEDNPGWIWMNLNQTSNWDNACTEPERKAEGQCGSKGELDEELEFVIWADDGDNVLQDDENVIFEGTAKELEEQSTAEGLLLDGDTSTNETEPFAGEETGYIGMKWNLPLETGNHIQGDSVSYDVEFYTEQRRHNDNPDNPWDSENDTEEPEHPETPVNETPENEFYQVDFVEGEPQEDLSEASYSSEERMQRYAHGGPDNPVDNETEADQVFSASGGEDCVDSNAFTTDLDEDTMSVNFDVHNDSSCEDIELSLVSYEKPYGGWIADRADEQEIFDSETETFSPGSHCMTVDIPDVNDGESENPGSCEDEAEDPNGSEGDNGDDNGETVCEEPQNSNMEYTADEIGQAMYGYNFEDLSGETKCEVEDLFNNQPFAEGLELGDLMTKDEISQDKFERDYDEISSDSKGEVDQAYNNQFMDEETEPSDTLSFSDQTVSEEGTVEVNDVTTNQASTVFITYESEDGLVNAGAHGATNIEDFDGMTIELVGPERSGEYTAHIIPTQNISSAYDPGDLLSESTASASLYSETANITGRADSGTEASYTATQGDTTVELEPIEGDETVQEFYDFRLPDNYDNEATRNAANGASFGSGPYYGSAGTEDIQQGDASLMFLYDGPEGLSFVVVHEGEGSNDGGSATFEITDLNGEGEWVVKDDLYLNDDGSIAGSNYDRWDTDSNPQTIDWTWGSGGSDGGAYGTLSEDFEFTIDPSFNNESSLYEDHYNGDVDEWQVISGNRNNPDRTTLDMNKEVTVTAN